MSQMKVEKWREQMGFFPQKEIENGDMYDWLPGSTGHMQIFHKRKSVRV